MIQGKSYRYFQHMPDDSGTRADGAYAADQVSFEGEAILHKETGAELEPCWVRTEDVRFVGEDPYAPDHDIPLEAVIEKMSKSRGNVVNPDDIIAKYGADSMRLYEMFMGPLRKAAPWSTDGIPGLLRFLQRSYRLVLEEGDGTDQLRAFADGDGTDAQQRLCAKTIDKVTRDVESLDLNTAISALMVFARDIEKGGPTPRSALEAFVKLLAPFAPHLAEELWAQLGHSESIAYAPWPEANEAMLQDDEVELVVQVKGKVRARIRVPADVTEERVRELALAEGNVSKHVGDSEPRRVIYVPGRLVNIVP
jgi:leucyl-tRNA synthetase